MAGLLRGGYISLYDRQVLRHVLGDAVTFCCANRLDAHTG